MQSVNKLTAHNYSIIELVTEGLTNKMIADEIGATERAVQSSCLERTGSSASGTAYN